MGTGFGNHISRTNFYNILRDIVIISLATFPSPFFMCIMKYRIQKYDGNAKFRIKSLSCYAHLR